MARGFFAAADGATSIARSQSVRLRFGLLAIAVISLSIPDAAACCVLAASSLSPTSRASLQSRCFWCFVGVQTQC